MHISEDFIYIRADLGHIPQIAAIERLSFSDPWPEASFTKEFGDGLARYFVAERVGFIAGYCGYWSIAGEAHITNVAVHPDHRRRGVGAGLIDAMLGDARVLGHTAATLEVRVGNTAAISLYERFGFKQTGIRKKYYDHGTKDAAIMWVKF